MTNSKAIIVDLKGIANILIREDLCSIAPIEKAIESLEENIKLKAEIEQLKAELEQSVKFKEYFMELYNQGLEVSNWHLNGDLEPLTNFIDSALEEAESTFERQGKRMSNLNELINNGRLKYADKKRIRIEIEIPEEFVGDLKSDRFEDFFERALADMNGDGCGGNYEREIAKMFICAFKNGIVSEVEE